MIRRHGLPEKLAALSRLSGEMPSLPNTRLHRAQVIP
jgi:hypothetical protein